MGFFYNISIRLYGVLLWLIQGLNPKAKAWVGGRKSYWSKLPVIHPTEQIYWFHCASLGEFDQGIPVMNLLKEQDPSLKILVTFFSPSGMEHYQKRKHCADYVYYLPLDTPNNAKRFLNHFNPSRIFFIKYEFWLNYLFDAKKRAIPMYSVSCILRPSQIYFKWYGGFFRKGLHCFTAFFVQNEETKELLQQIHIQQVSVTGDTRFDKVIENKKLVQKDNLIELFLQGEKAIILGSSWSVEEELFHAYYQKLHLKPKVIIAPHDISEGHLTAIEKTFGSEMIRYSQLDENSNQNILLIDCIGKLANAYSYGKIAFIGGGFTGKLHNTLEPVVFGLPVLFGPKHRKFPEAEKFINAGIAFTIQNEAEFTESVHKIENNLLGLQNICLQEIEKSTGAATKIISKIS
jgi:3-deoxy-D-manno-octulosonic-acid transferase